MRWKKTAGDSQIQCLSICRVELLWGRELACNWGAHTSLITEPGTKPWESWTGLEAAGASSLKFCLQPLTHFRAIFTSRKHDRTTECAECWKGPTRIIDFNLQACTGPCVCHELSWGSKPKSSTKHDFQGFKLCCYLQIHGWGPFTICVR